MNTSEQKTENSWSECYQDLASWCRLPQDELNTPIVSNSSEFKFSFDDQSMYNSWEHNPSSVDLKGEMWKEDEADLLPLQYTSEVDNNTSLQMPEILPDNLTVADTTSIKYSCNLFLSSDFNQSLINQPINRIENPLMLVNNTSLADTLQIKRPNIPTKPNNITMNKPKPALKLNIAAANTKEQPSSDLPPLNINTPDVFNLTNDSSFNIFSYVEGADDQSLCLVDPTNIVLPRPKETQATCEQVIKIDHDYVESQPSSQSDMPLSVGTVKGELLEMDDRLEAFVDVKEEPSSPSPSTSMLGKRERKTIADDDYEYGGESLSDQSMDWSPLAKKSRKTVKKKALEGVRVRTSSMSDSGSVTSGPDKYRELRDRNNEASRRSRMNRKQKEVEMSEKASILEQQNQYLKVKADSLEKRVKALREILLKVVLEKNKQ